MINWPNFISQLFNGLALGALLALISSGLTIIYGTLGVLNLAHGAMFMLGGYAGYVAFEYSGSYIVAVIAGSLFVAIVGILMERIVIRHFYSRPPEDQLLVTFGFGIVFVEIVPISFQAAIRYSRRGCNRTRPASASGLCRARFRPRRSSLPCPSCPFASCP